MPTYEYVCRDCGEHLEVVQSFKDEALTICPACEGSLKKVFGNIGIVFKGSGFYKTDSRSGSSSTAVGKTDKPETAVTSDSSSTKSEPAKSDSAKSDAAKSDSAKQESSKSDSKGSSSSTGKSTTTAAAAS